MRPSLLCCSGLLLTFLLQFGGCTSSTAPAADGGLAYGAVSDFNMIDYYYPRQAGKVFLFSHRQENYNTSGALVGTFPGSTDTVRTLGYQGMAPTGDSMFAVSITYRVLKTYAGRPEMTLWYKKNGSSKNGAFLDGQTDGAVAPPRPTKPVPCDTILAGLYGRMKSVSDDFESAGERVWQSDRIYFSGYRDSVLIWYQDSPGGALRTIRQVFYTDIRRQLDWQYAVWENSENMSVLNVVNDDMALTIAGTSRRAAQIEVITPDDDMPTREWKWFAHGLGPCKQVDEWYVSKTGNVADRMKRVMTRELTQVLQ